jgi:magnesium chelatase subunit I
MPDWDGDEVVAWFDEGGALRVPDDEPARACVQAFGTVPGLLGAVRAGQLAGDDDPGGLVAGCELLLEGLAGRRRISRTAESGYARARPERRGPPGGGGKLGMY